MRRPRVSLEKRLGVALRFRATPLRRRVERDRFVIHYWYLCRRAARRFVQRGLDRADLEQVGAIGLIKAAERYDASQRAPFEAYAWLSIVGELMHYTRDCARPMRAPRSVRRLYRRWSGAERELASALAREPSETEIARRTGASASEVAELAAYRASTCVLSFEQLNDAERRTPYEIDEVLDRLMVERMLQGLTPLQRQIVISIHLHGSTVVELARRLGYSRRHVTRLHRAALEQLRQSTEVARLRGAEARTGVPLPYGR